jgi:hypothetical protein
MLLTLFYIFLVGWIAGVIRFFNIGRWNWALLGMALVFLAIHIVLVKRKKDKTVERAVHTTADDTKAKPAA